MCWLLTSYVLIGLFETLLGLARKLRRTTSSEPAEETLNTGV
jgi:hypothetical protein